METTLKKLILAGIGTMAVTYEKSKEVVDELVKKGEIAVGDGKELNEELKRKIGKRAEQGREFSEEGFRKIVSGMGFATEKEIEELRERIEKLEQNSGS